MTASSNPGGPRYRKLLRWGAWCLAAGGIFLVGRAAGWGATRFREAREQQATVAELRVLGARVYYDFQLITTEGAERLADDDGRDSQPHWLAGLAGKDAVHRVFYVSFAQFRTAQPDSNVAASREEIDDRVAAQLARLRGLQWVALTGTHVTDAGIARLAELPELERLWLSQTRLTDEGLAAVGKARNLTHLSIEGTLVTDAGMDQVARLPRLHTFSAGSPQLTAAGVARLRASSTLRELYLERSPIGDEAAESLAVLGDLRVLSLRGTQFGDGGLEKLAALSDLEVLHLDDTTVGDRGLAACRSMPKLRELTLTRTRVSDVGLAELAGCRQIRSLRLEGTACTLSGVRHLFEELQQRTLTEALQAAAIVRRDGRGEIVSVDLRGIPAANGDLEALAALGELQWLSLYGNAAVDDDGIPALGKLEELTLLNLNYTQLTDAGLEQLVALPRLRDLHVAGTRVTDDGIAAVQRSAGNRLRIYTAEFDARSVHSAH